MLGKEFKDCVLSVIYGPLWYLLMLIGLLLVTPMLKAICEKGLSHYFILLALIFGFIVPTIQNSLDIYMLNISNCFSIVVNDIGLFMCIGYSGYYMLGYELTQKPLNNRNYLLAVVLGVISFIVLPILSSLASISLKNDVLFYDNMNIGVCFESIMVFLVIKDGYCHFSRFIRTCFLMISRYSLGIYLIHKIVIDILNHFGYKWDFINPIVWIPFSSILVFFISFILVFLLKRIPYVKLLL